MAVETQEILAEADKLGNLVAQHPAVGKYRQAQRSVAEDPDASRLLSEMDRTIETLGRQEQSGMPVTDAQRQKLESLQSQLMSNIKVKALNMAQVDFIDLLRKVNQSIQGKLIDTP